MKAYEDMLVFYAMKNLTKEDCLQAKVTVNQVPARMSAVQLQAKVPAYQTEWLNIGGQLVAKPDMEQLIADVENGSLRNWDDIHDRFNTLWGDHYKAQKLAHCYGMLCRLAGVDTLDKDLWQQYLTRYNNILDYIDEQKELSRRKDKENTFRNMTYWDDAEREAVLGY
jgi:hypothetical protein